MAYSWQSYLFSHPNSRLQQTTHLHALDGLRGVAALCILFLHAAQTLDLTYVPPSAGLGVDFFFLLSGYVLAFAYDRKLEADTDTQASQFAVRRIVRLYPMLFLGTGLGVVVGILGYKAASPLLILGSFFLFPVGFVSGIEKPQAYPYNNPVWSLFFELAVNFLYGSRFGRSKVSVLFSVVALSVIGLAVTSSVVVPDSFQLIGFGSPTLFIAGVFRVGCSFWLGVILFRLGASHKTKGLPLWLTSSLLFAVLLSPISGLFYSFITILIIFPVLVVSTAATHISPLERKICTVGGQLSYPLYLLHQPVFRIFKNIPVVLHVELSGALLFLGGITVSVGVAFAALYLIDIPVRRYLGSSLVPFFDKRASRL